MKLLAGLGNPGNAYAGTRHNIGFDLLDFLHDAWDCNSWEEKKKFKSFIAKGKIGSTPLLLIKPQTFMNKSGEAIQLIASYFDIKPDDIWVIHDELDLPYPSFKVQKERGAASHNGVESIISALNTNAFNRIRIGVSPSAHKRPSNSKNFVLKKFSFFERRKKEILFKEIKEHLENIL